MRTLLRGRISEYIKGHCINSIAVICTRYKVAAAVCMSGARSTGFCITHVHALACFGDTCRGEEKRDRGTSAVTRSIFNGLFGL